MVFSRLPRWLAPGLFVLALGAALWRVPMADKPTFMPLPSPVREPSVAPERDGWPEKPELLRQGGWLASPSLSLLPDGRLAAAWVAGSAPDADDVSIWFSTLERQGWREPRVIASRETAAAGLLAHVREVGAPMLYAEGGWLHLWFSAAGPLGRYGRGLAHQVSTDGGKTWSKPSRLAVSPLGHFNSEVRGVPVLMADGGLALPLSRTGFSPHGEWLRLSSTGVPLDKIHLVSEQPTLPPALTDTPFALLRLRSGQLLLAGNGESGVNTLHLWIGDAEGKHWHQRELLEHAIDGGAEFTAPSMAQTRDGRVHLLYVWRRQAIRHLVLSENWLLAVP